MSHRITVIFSLFSHDLSPDELWRVVGKVPSKRARVGERIFGNIGPVADINSISYRYESLSGDYEKPIEAASVDIFEFCPRISKSKELIESQLSVVMYLDPESTDSVPPCYLPKEWINSLALAGSAIDFDIYLMNEGE